MKSSSAAKSKIAASVPSAVETKADAMAMMKLLPNEDQSFSDAKKSFRYHWSEKPVAS